MKSIRKTLSTLLLFGSLAYPAQALSTTASGANVRVIHGIPGQDLGLSPELAVDVEVDGAVILAGFEYREIAGPLNLPAGTYLIEISLADEENPGSNAPVISANVPFVDGEDATVIAHLDAAGGPTASKFVNNADSAPFLQTRVSLHHTAAAPPVDLALDRFFPFFGGSLFLGGVENGQAAIQDLFLGIFRFQATVAGTNNVVLGPAFGFLAPGVDHRVYVVGSASTGSLSLIVQPLYL